MLEAAQQDWGGLRIIKGGWVSPALLAKVSK